MVKKLIAVDLGASSGKMAISEFDGSELKLLEEKSFSNQPVNIGTALYWDVFALYKSILDGFSYFRAKYGEIQSVGIDTWGATYGLLDQKGRLLEPVYHYRDNRTAHVMKAMQETLSSKDLFFLTGCQPNRTYTLPQLFSYNINNDSILELADSMLFLPDLLGYFLSGEKSTELTIAGTSGLLDNTLEHWSNEVSNVFSIPSRIYTDFIYPGSIKGNIRADIVDATGLDNTKLVATIGHDSASAVAAIPEFTDQDLYISVGTNISMGVESKNCLVDEFAYANGMKNTGGFAGSKIIYRDFSACWHINEFLKDKAEHGSYYNFDQINAMAKEAGDSCSWIDVENPILCEAGNKYIERIELVISHSNQTNLKSDSEVIRSIYESIALKTAFYAQKFFSVFPCKRVFVISGGTHNKLLMQFISNALQRPIRVCLPNASLIGNILCQCHAVGELSGLKDMRKVSSDFSNIEEYNPEDTELWIEKLDKYKKINFV